MENSQSEPGEDMSFEQNISQDFNTDGQSGSQQSTFGQVGGGSVFPHYRLVILSLGLLNAVLLIAAVVIGIYCAKGGYLQVPDSAATPLIIEMNFLLNNRTDIVRAKLEAEAQLATERSSHLQLKMQMKPMITLTDSLQEQIETLQRERTNLRYNVTTLEESCGKCREGWRLLNSSCYYFSVNDLPKNWLDSRANCISQGGELLVIDNVEEQMAISDFMSNHQKPTTALGRIGFWIGLTDVQEEGVWKWLNGTRLTEGYWVEGQPNNAGDEDCAAIYPRINPIKTWNDASCSLELKWICQKTPS